MVGIVTKREQRGGRPQAMREIDKAVGRFGRAAAVKGTLWTKIHGERLANKPRGARMVGQSEAAVGAKLADGLHEAPEREAGENLA